jgi:hypothetical protein
MIKAAVLEHKSVRPCTCDRADFPPTSPRYCRKCWKWYNDPAYRAHCEGRLIRINHGAGGLGDTLQGLLAVGGLRLDRPDAHIVYRINPYNAGFARLWDGGYDELGEHSPDQTKDDFDDGDLQMNRGYNRECQSPSAPPRVIRYARNIGTERTVMPTLRNPQHLLRRGRPYHGSVLLAPFSTDKSRNWHLKHWLALEKLLRSQGYRVVIVDNEEQRCRRFHAEKILGRDAEELTGIFMNAAAVVSNDSGPAHLGGILGRPTVVLCGPSGGERIYGCYKDCHYAEGHLGCSLCWWQTPFDPEDCQPSCQSLSSIAPSEVATMIERLINNG